MALTKVQTIGIETGISLAGVTTVVTLNASGNVTAVDGTFTGNVSVAGTLTYEDVTNVDSVGLITARNGVSVTGGDFKVGSATTISQDNIFTTGIVTATSFYGDGSNLTGISVDSTQIVTGDTSVQTVDTGSDGHVKVTTEGTERLRVDSSGNIGIRTTSPTRPLTVAAGSGETVNILGVFDTRIANPATVGNSVIAFSDPTSTAGQFSTRLGSVGDSLAFYTNGSNERMRIDSQGRMGLGTASPAHKLVINQNNSGGIAAIHLPQDESTILGSNSNTNIRMGGNMNVSAGGALIFETAGSEVARIDSVGRLLLGTTTEGHPNADDFTIAGSGHAGITIRSGTTSVGGIFFSDATTGSGEYDGAIEYNQNTQSMSFYTAAGEAVRISSDNEVMLGHTSQITGNQFLSIRVQSGYNGASFEGDSTVGRSMITFRNPNGEVGYISTSGSSTGYSTSSDYRLKENVVAVSDGIARLKQLRPSRFNFIVDPDKTVDGFIAHEVQDVVPEAIFGEKDAVDDEGNPKYQGIDQAKLVPLLTAALQEAIAKIETLETANASLEARLTALEGQ